MDDAQTVIVSRLVRMVKMSKIKNSFLTVSGGRLFCWRPRRGFWTVTRQPERKGSITDLSIDPRAGKIKMTLNGLAVGFEIVNGDDEDACCIIKGITTEAPDELIRWLGADQVLVIGLPALPKEPVSMEF